MYQRCIQELPVNAIASNLNVDPSTVYRTVKLFEQTGTVCRIFKDTASHLSESSHHMMSLPSLALSWTSPSSYLKDIQKHLLQSAGFTRKKLTLRAQQRNDEKFMNEVAIYDPSMLVHIRKYSQFQGASHTFSNDFLYLLFCYFKICNLLFSLFSFSFVNTYP